MNHCPSRGLENYLADMETPETCPMCGKPNMDEATGEWLCPEAEGFCSKACQDQLLAAQNACADELINEILEEERLIKEHNSKCPKCKGKGKYCFCSTNPENQEG